MTSSIKKESAKGADQRTAARQKRRTTMTETKTTQKDLYARIATEMAYDEEIVEFCAKKIAQIEKNAARPRKPKINQEVIDFREDVFNALANHAEPMTNKELAAEFGVSAQKMSAALRFLVKEGRVDRHEGEKKSDPATFTA